MGGGGGVVFGSCFVVQSSRWGRESFRFIALHFNCLWCHVTVSFLWFFLMVPWVTLHCKIMAFSGHTHHLQTFI